MWFTDPVLGKKEEKLAVIFSVHVNIKKLNCLNNLFPAVCNLHEENNYKISHRPIFLLYKSDPKTTFTFQNGFLDGTCSERRTQNPNKTV